VEIAAAVFVLDVAATLFVVIARWNWKGKVRLV
jgi:hypothetical protein